jgi:hypothetical protein
LSPLRRITVADMIIMDYPDKPILVTVGKIAVRHGHLDYSLKMAFGR